MAPREPMKDDRPKNVRETIVYSNQKGDFVKGVRYANPRFFDGAREGVKRCIVVGNWPLVAAAYHNAGAQVVQLESPFEVYAALAPKGATVARPVRPAVAPAQAGKPPAPQAPAAAAPAEEIANEPLAIPRNWKELPWPNQRKLAMAFNGGAEIKNRPDAIAAIEAEVARRGAAQPAAPKAEAPKTATVVKA